MGLHRVEVERRIHKAVARRVVAHRVVVRKVKVVVEEHHRVVVRKAVVRKAVAHMAVVHIVAVAPDAVSCFREVHVLGMHHLRLLEKDNQKKMVKSSTVVVFR